ncbi:MAG: ABC transporter permease [bacterium]|nr:ABC transporter permease [bacterium]
MKLRKLIETHSLWVFLIALIVVLAVQTDFAFVRPENATNILSQMPVEMLIALGMTLVIITAGIDLSVGSLVGVAGVLGTMALTVSTRLPLYLAFFIAILASVLVGFACGSISGLVITRFGIPPFVATLAMMFVCRGLAFIICREKPVEIPIEYERFTFLGRGILGKGLLGLKWFPGIPLSGVIMLAGIIFFHVLLSGTVFGRQIYAVGGNEEAARLSGINVKKIKFLVYAVTGALCGLSGIIQSATLGSGDPKSGDKWELQVIAAVVVGGTSLFGGKGTIIGTFVGVLLIRVLAVGVNFLGFSRFWQYVVLGSVLLLAVLVDTLSKRVKS